MINLKRKLDLPDNFNVTKEILESLKEEVEKEMLNYEITKQEDDDSSKELNEIRDLYIKATLFAYKTGIIGKNNKINAN